MRPEEGILTIKVRDKDHELFNDRANPFENVSVHPLYLEKSKSKAFAMACSTLSAVNSMNDGRNSH